MLAKSCSKSSKLGFNSTWTEKFQMFKLDLEELEQPEIKLPTSVGSSKKQGIPEKHVLLLHWLCQSLWLYGSQQTMGNSSRDGNTRPPNLPPEKPVCRSRSKRTGHEQQTGSKLGKEYVKAIYCHPASLTYMQSNHVKCRVGWSTSWIQDCQ